MKLEHKKVVQAGFTIEGTWVPFDCFEDLQDVDGYEGFESGCVFPRDIEIALVKAGLAHNSTRGSMFPSNPAFKDFMNEIEWE